MDFITVNQCLNHKTGVDFITVCFPVRHFISPYPIRNGRLSQTYEGGSRTGILLFFCVFVSTIQSSPCLISILWTLDITVCGLGVCRGFWVQSSDKSVPIIKA